MADEAASIRSEITQTSSSWEAKISGVTGSDGKVTAASIAVAINSAGEGVATINADKIYLLGTTIANTVTAQYIANKMASIATLNVNTITAGAINVKVNNQTTSPVATQTYVNGCIWDLQFITSGNTYTLQKKALGTSGWTDVGSFSRAVASWTMGWSSGKFTVKANPQNQSCNTQLVQGSTSWSGNIATVVIQAIDSNSPNVQYNTGRSIAVDASARYTAGHTAGYNSGYDTGAATAKVSGSNNITSNGTYVYKGIYVDRTTANDTESGNNLTVTVAVPSSEPTLSDLGIYDYNYQSWSGNQYITSGWSLWAGYRKNGVWQWGPELKVFPDYTGWVSGLTRFYGVNSSGGQAETVRMRYFNEYRQAWEDISTAHKWYYKD